MAEQEKSYNLPVLLVLSQLTGLSASFMIIYWVVVYGGGASWEDTSHVFNWHPILMIVGLIYLNGSALLMYRAFPTYPKLVVKILHCVFLTSALCMAIAALTAVFKSKGNSPHITSIHSWVGITTVVIFASQLVVGVLAFLLPTMPMTIRALYKPLHVWAGGLMFMFAIVAVIAGLTEKSYGKLDAGSPSYLLINGTGMMVLAFGIIVYLVLLNPSYTRPAEQYTHEEIR